MIGIVIFAAILLFAGYCIYHCTSRNGYGIEYATTVAMLALPAVLVIIVALAVLES